MGESIQCWQCGTRMTLGELASNDGDCPRCEVEVHLAEYLDNALSKVATLEAENAKLRAELGRRVPDGWSVTEDGNSIIVRPDGRMAVELSKGGRPGERVMWEFMRAMLSAAQSAPKAGSGIYADDPLACNGCASGCFRCRTSAPKADDPVKVQLLEALAAIVNDGGSFRFTHELHVKARAAIAAARQEGGKV